MNWTSYWLGVATPFAIALAASVIYLLAGLCVYYFTTQWRCIRCRVCGVRIGAPVRWTVHRHFNRRHRQLWPSYKAACDAGRSWQWVKEHRKGIES